MELWKHYAVVAHRWGRGRASVQEYVRRSTCLLKGAFDIIMVIWVHGRIQPPCKVHTASVHAQSSCSENTSVSLGPLQAHRSQSANNLSSGTGSSQSLSADGLVTVLYSAHPSEIQCSPVAN